MFVRHLPTTHTRAASRSDAVAHIVATEGDRRGELADARRPFSMPSPATQKANGLKTRRPRLETWCAAVGRDLRELLRRHRPAGRAGRDGGGCGLSFSIEFFRFRRSPGAPPFRAFFAAGPSAASSGGGGGISSDGASGSAVGSSSPQPE